MADAGFLAGLGAALQEFGGQWSAKAAKDLANKLELEREERAEQRLIAREERQARKATGSRVYQDEQGATWRVGVNAAGEPVTEPVLASPYEIKDYNQQEEDRKRKLALDDLSLWLKEQEVADYGEDKELKREYTREQIASMRDSRARGWASLAARGSGKGGLESELSGPISPGQAAADWIRDNKTFVDRYFKPDEQGNSPLSPTEMLRVVSTAIQTAAERNKDVNQTVLGALEAYPSIIAAKRAKAK